MASFSTPIESGTPVKSWYQNRTPLSVAVKVTSITEVANAIQLSGLRKKMTAPASTPNTNDRKFK